MNLHQKTQLAPLTMITALVGAISLIAGILVARADGEDAPKPAAFRNFT